MDVKKIFIILIVVVCCVIVGAFIINILLPNVVTGMVTEVEKQIFNATGVTLNLDGVDSVTTQSADGNAAYKGAGVAGFSGGNNTNNGGGGTGGTP